MRQLDIYKQSARGNSAVRKVDRRIKEMEQEKEEEMDDLRSRLRERENEISKLMSEPR